MKTGIQRITEELERQRAKGYSEDHDDGHDLGELTEAALCYGCVAGAEARGSSAEEWPAHMFDGHCDSILQWPWDEESWKPSDDPIINLAKAGALIAAEIDRLERKKEWEAQHAIDKANEKADDCDVPFE